MQSKKLSVEEINYLHIANLAGRAIVLVDIDQGQTLADLRSSRMWTVPAGEEFEPLVDDLAMTRAGSTLIRVELESPRIRAAIPLPGNGVISGLSRLGRTRFSCTRGSENIYFDADAKRGVLKIVEEDFKN